MIEFTEPNYYDPEYDSCGNTTVAVFKINSVSIPLCSDCLEELKDEIKKYEESKFCSKCKHFGCSESGIRYGGSCLIEDPNLPKSEYGHRYTRDRFSICNNGKFEKAE